MFKKAILGVTMLAFAALILPTQAFAPETTFKRDVETWLAKFNDSNTYYVVFDNGLIANGGRNTRLWTTYVDKGAVILWHCGVPARFDIASEAAILLRGKPMQYLEEGGELVEGQYKTQCQLDMFPGSVRAHLGG